MKIVQICFSGLGGHSGVVFPLISADSMKEHEWFIGFIGNAQLLPDFQNKCIDLGIKYNQFYFRPGLPFIQWFNLFKWLKKTSPDSIICHSPSFIIPCKLYSLLKTCKIIVVEHTNNKLKRRRERFFSCLSLYLAHSIVVLTLDYKNELKTFFLKNLQEKKISIIPNGIDCNLFPVIKNHINDSPVKNLSIGMAGRFSETKKQDLLVEMLKNINIKKHEININLFFAGDGPTLSETKNHVISEGLESFVTFEGLLNESELPGWYKKLDIYVHASLGETLSISLLHAMSCGLPIVASEVDGISNLLNQDKDYGFCVANDPNLFAEKIIDISINYQQAKAMGLEASALIANHYSNKKMLQEYIHLL